MSLKNQREVDRSAFLKPEWVTFLKEGYTKIENQQREFEEKWKRGKIPRKMPTAPWIPPSRAGSRIEESPRIASPTEAPFAKGEDFYWERSPRACATINEETMKYIKSRVSKKERRVRREKCLGSNSVSAVFNPGEAKASITNYDASRSSSRHSSCSSTSGASRSRGTLIRAFGVMQERLDERRGLSIKMHELFLKNQFKKFDVKTPPTHPENCTSSASKGEILKSIKGSIRGKKSHGRKDPNSSKHAKLMLHALAQATRSGNFATIGATVSDFILRKGRISV